MGNTIPFVFMQIRLRIILIFFGILLAVCCSQFVFSENQQLTFMLVTFLLFGVPHGSLDLFIDANSGRYEENRIVFIRYVATVAAYGILWYLLPEYALILFILITAFHFGEIDWIGNYTGLKHKWKYFLLGFCWILFLLSSHIQEAINIFDAITRRLVDKSIFIDFAHYAYFASIVVMFALYVFLYFNRKVSFPHPRLYYFSLLQQAFLFLLSSAMPLWFFFAFYFGIWHSVLSLDKIRIHMKKVNTLQEWFKLLKLAMPFSVLAWIGIVYFILLTSRMDDKPQMLSIVFIGLSVLTLPHLQIFTKLNSSK